MKDLTTMSATEILQEVWKKAEEMNRLTPTFKWIYEEAKKEMLEAEARGKNPLKGGKDATYALEVFMEKPETEDYVLEMLATIP